MSSESRPPTPLCILHVEDNPSDAELIERLLVREGLVVDIRRVFTREDFLMGLRHLPIDLILSDYDLPQFHGLAALELARTRRPDVPFIFVSGFLSDDLAAESLQRGATDYLMKDRLARLVPAVQRAIEHAKDKARSSTPQPGQDNGTGNEAQGGRGTGA